MIYVIFGTGFEEMEAVAPVDILRRAGQEVKTVGIGGKYITGAHGIKMETDCTVESVAPKGTDMVVLPGGMGGVESIMGSNVAMKLVKDVYDMGGTAAAICAAPMVLAKLGITEGKKATIYPGMEGELAGAQAVTNVKTCVDGRIITAQGPGAAADFALELVRYTAGEKEAQTVRSAIHYK